MKDVQDLINNILSKIKVADITNNETETTSQYNNEPIIKTATELKNDTPNKIREMRKIKAPYKGVYYNFDADIKQFYKQGKFMADYEDEYEFTGEFSKYFPTYQSMNDIQLRGYFSWRTKVRKGIIEKTSLSFTYLYIYELINNIGVSSPLDGFEKIISFWDSYKALEPRISYYLSKWTKDYVIYYNLDYNLLSAYDKYNSSKQLEILYNPSLYNQAEVTLALNYFSNYNITKSKFYKNYSDDFNKATYKAYTDLAQYFAKNRKNSIFTRLFGNVRTTTYNIFAGAIFNKAINTTDRKYIINPIEKYYYKNGYWQSYCCRDINKRNKIVGEILRIIDSLMRQIYDFPNLISYTSTSKVYFTLIERSVNDFCNVSKKRGSHVLSKNKINTKTDTPEIKEVVIDSTKFDEIRKTADIVQQKLIIPDESEAAELQEIEEADDTGLNIDEKAIARALLLKDTKKVNQIVKEKGLMLSVVVEKINEKLFEKVNDNVIDIDNDIPYIIDDYINDVKEELDK